MIDPSRYYGWMGQIIRTLPRYHRGHNNPVVGLEVFLRGIVSLADQAVAPVNRKFSIILPVKLKPDTPTYYYFDQDPRFKQPFRAMR